MSKAVEIYIRNSGSRTLLNFHIPSDLKEAFISALRDGSFSEAGVDIALEVSMLPQWITDADQRSEAQECDHVVHARIPLSSINVQVTD